MTRQPLYKTVVIACGIFQHELEMVAKDADVQVRFLGQGLHENPKKLTSLIQEEINCIGNSANRVVLGYGFCSGGIKGIKAGCQDLVIPRCHDCITIFMGSQKAYRENFRARPGTYYLTPGWIATEVDPLGILNNHYAPKHGIEMATKVVKKQLQHYTHISFINTGVGDTERLKARTKENCAIFGKEYSEFLGSQEYFQKIVHGPYEKEDFIIIPPWGEVTEDHFLCN